VSQVDEKKDEQISGTEARQTPPEPGRTIVDRRRFSALSRKGQEVEGITGRTFTQSKGGYNVCF
jgi:hypothetical protein